MDRLPVNFQRFSVGAETSAQQRVMRGSENTNSPLASFGSMLPQRWLLTALAVCKDCSDFVYRGVCSTYKCLNKQIVRYVHLLQRVKHGTSGDGQQNPSNKQEVRPLKEPVQT